MDFHLTRIDRDLPMPAYQTPGSVAFDLYARVETVIAPHAIGLVPTNIIVQIPEGYALLVAPRSSAPSKKGLSIPHGIGIVDQDYRGPKDEVLAQFYNFTDAPVTVARGERIAQALVTPVERVALVEMELATEVSRGGVGSTGGHS